MSQESSSIPQALQLNNIQCHEYSIAWILAIYVHCTTTLLLWHNKHCSICHWATLKFCDFVTCMYFGLNFSVFNNNIIVVDIYVLVITCQGWCCWFMSDHWRIWKSRWLMQRTVLPLHLTHSYLALWLVGQWIQTLHWRILLLFCVKMVLGLGTIGIQSMG